MKRFVRALVLAPLLGIAPLAAAATPLFQPPPAASAAPVHWDACHPIHWRFNAANAPHGGLAVVQRAIRSVAKATQTTWVYDGLSTTTPSSAYLPADLSRKDVLIGWTDASRSDLLAGVSPKVVAETKTAWSAGYYTSAVIALNRHSVMPLSGGGSWHTTVLHELGHVMGLSHSTSRRSLMYPMQLRALTGYQATDLLALKAVGRAAGCAD